MKIIHCCFAQFYIDDFSYQENILTKMHKLQGHEVYIIASTETYVNNETLGYLEPGSYFTKEGIPVTRLPYSKWLPHFLAKKLRIFVGIINALETFSPDIIFIHGSQFISITDIVSYVKKHTEIRVYVDSHTDFINSAKNWLSRRILHGLVYKWCTKKIEPYTKKFYGVLPIRVDFLKFVYGIAASKVELLELGADDSIFDLTKKEEIRKLIRKKLSINESDFVLVTGGKIDQRKKIHVLMNAVINLHKEDIKLIVFGTPNQQMKVEIEELVKFPVVRYVGWIPSEKAYDFFFAADVGFFPGTHSVAWEQAVGVGLPCVFKKWDGIQHIDLDGNCLFINSSDIEEIKEKILLLYNDHDLLLNLKKIAEKKGVPKFSYYEIAKRAIEE